MPVEQHYAIFNEIDVFLILLVTNRQK